MCFRTPQGMKLKGQFIVAPLMARETVRSYAIDGAWDGDESPDYKPIFEGIGHVLSHTAKDENLGAHASSVPFPKDKTGRLEACAPRDFRGRS
jgi:hypothetical protein